MDTLITKRLHISGLTPAITPEALTQRLASFGTVKSVDGFGLQDGLGQPRKFVFVTLETTAGRLSRCLTLLSGSTWKGARLQIGEARPDFSQRLAQAADTPLPEKRRKRFAAAHADDMSLVTLENVKDRPGWRVTPLGRMLRPIKMRPMRPLPSLPQEGQAKKRNSKLPAVTPKAKSKRRMREPEVRARRRTIDMTRWGSVHLKGMFLDVGVPNAKHCRQSPPVGGPTQDTKLEGLFAPREEEAPFSLLSQLDLDLEVGDESPLFAEPLNRKEPLASSGSISVTHQSPFLPTVAPASIVLNPRQPLFFPLLPSRRNTNKARPKDVFDLAKSNGWDWRDHSLAFFRTDSEDDLRKHWERDRGELTRAWKRRCREAKKFSRRRGGRVEDQYE